MRMHLLASVVLSLAAVVCGQQAADASVVVTPGNWVVLSTGGGAVRYGDGGEFQVNVYAPGSFNAATGNPIGAPIVLGSFYTFCGDVNHVFVPGRAYRVDAVGAAPGSFNNSVGGWLFANYWGNSDPVLPGSLSGYVPGHAALANNPTIGGIARGNVAGAIQDTIWQSLGFASQFGSLAGTADGVFHWSSAWNNATTANQLLSLYGPNNNYGYGNPAQAQLYIPGSGTGVPEPATLVVWSLLAAGSWLGMRIWRRGGPTGRQPWSPESRQAIHDLVSRTTPR